MAQKSIERWIKRNQETAELQAELNRAYQTIQQLRQKNAELECLILDLQTSSDRSSKVLAKKRLISSLEKKSSPSKQTRLKTVEYQSKKYFYLSSNFGLLAIIILFAVLFTIGVLAIGDRSKKNKQSIDKNYNLSQPRSTSQKKISEIYLPKISSSSEPIYQPDRQTKLNKSQDLQKIVDKIVNLAVREKLPTNVLSISLIDVNSKEFAEYQQEQLRYPASVVKLFWMVALYGKYAAGTIPDLKSFYEDLSQMVQHSHNEAASHIIDAITETKSLEKLNNKEYQNWLNKRYWLNRFFQKAGYKNINISQKTYPILSENLPEPKGADLQMRGDLKKPIRNQISTKQAARLMYEIVTNQAISAKYSQEMLTWLVRDLKSKEWQKIDPKEAFNPVINFFGESLPPNVYFASKAGLTSNTRQEVAFVRTSDGKTAYILAIFAEDSSYVQNEKIFPKMSRLVFDRLTNNN